MIRADGTSSSGPRAGGMRTKWSRSGSRSATSLQLRCLAQAYLSGSAGVQAIGVPRQGTHSSPFGWICEVSESLVMVPVVMST